MDTSKETILSEQEIAVIEKKNKSLISKSNKINPIDYGLNADKAKNIEKSFLPKIVERNALVIIYQHLLSTKITLKLTREAKAVRLKLVKVRIGIAEIHKTEKAYFRAAGLFVDAWKNKETLPVIQMEEKLFEIEDYYNKIERDKLDAVEKKRINRLQRLEVDTEHYDLRKMTESGFKQILESSKIAFDSRVEKEKKAEQDRIAEEKFKTDEVEKNKKENKRLTREAEKREKDIEKKRIKLEKLQAELDKKEHIEAEKKRIQKEKDDKEANASDRVKLEQLAISITAMNIPEVKSKKAKDAIEGVVNLLNTTSNYLKKKALEL